MCFLAEATYFSCKNKPLSGQIGLCLIADGVIEMTLITLTTTGWVCVFTRCENTTSLNVILVFSSRVHVHTFSLSDHEETQSASLHRAGTLSIFPNVNSG